MKKKFKITGKIERKKDLDELLQEQSEKEAKKLSKRQKQKLDDDEKDNYTLGDE